jgi:hypothetical protein
MDQSFATAEPNSAPPAACAACGAACCAQCGGGESDAAWEQRLLKELAEVGMDLARRVKRQADEANWLGVDGPKMFLRISLSVRRCMAQRIWFKEKREAMARRAANPAPARPAAERKPEPVVVPKPEPETVEPKKARIKQAVADALTTSDLNPREAERLLSDLYDRLDDPGLAAELCSLTEAEIIAKICEPLGVTVDVWPVGPEAPGPDERPRDFTIRPIEPVAPVPRPPRPPEIRSNRMGVVSIGGLVLGAASPGLPHSCFGAGRDPPRQ